MTLKKLKFGRKTNPNLIAPFGTMKSKNFFNKNGGMTPNSYNLLWNGSPVNIPPSWNPLLLQDSSTFKIGINRPKLSDTKFGKTKKISKKKPSKKLKLLAKKYNIKVTIKKRNKKNRVYKSEKFIKKQLKNAIKKQLKKKTITKINKKERMTIFGKCNSKKIKN